MTAAAAARIGLRVEQRAQGALAFLTLDNRSKLNTLDRALMLQFVAEVDELAKRDDLRALVLTGAGEKAFIGGASIPEMAALDEDSARISSRWCIAPATACAVCPCR